MVKYILTPTEIFLVKCLIEEFGGNWAAMKIGVAYASLKKGIEGEKLTYKVYYQIKGYYPYLRKMYADKLKERRND